MRMYWPEVGAYIKGLTKSEFRRKALLDVPFICSFMWQLALFPSHRSIARISILIGILFPENYKLPWIFSSRHLFEAMLTLFFDFQETAPKLPNSVGGDVYWFAKEETCKHSTYHAQWWNLRLADRIIWLLPSSTPAISYGLSLIHI